jgi:hypothetical protein
MVGGVVSAPDWLKLTLSPAIVIGPDLATEDVFDATVYVTDPVPEPFAPLVIVTQLRALVAVQEQPAEAVTLTEPDPPEGPSDNVVGEQANVQVRPDWPTTNDWSPMVIVPERALEELFVVRPKFTVPLPVPLLPVVTTSQAESLVAVQAHAAAAVTLTLLAPPV